MWFTTSWGVVRCSVALRRIELGEFLLGNRHLIVIGVLVEKQLGAQCLGRALVNLRPEGVSVLSLLVLGLLKVGFRR